jgi:hypothetical protein
MKVIIGPYINWVGPYQLADLLQHVGVSKDRCFKIGEWLADTWVNTVCQWIFNKRKRKVVVKLDRWDSWSADHTLSLIILPLLKQLHATKHGSPIVDNEDTPESMHGPENVEVDDKIHERWEYVMTEMIWTFEQISMDDWEAQYFSNGFSNYDVEGHKAHQARINNGLRLFGKYYQGLWD